MPRVHRAEGFYAESEGGGSDDDLEQLTKAELVELAEQRSVDSTGTKAEIIARLSGD